MCLERLSESVIAQIVLYFAKEQGKRAEFTGENECFQTANGHNRDHVESFQCLFY